MRGMLIAAWTALALLAALAASTPASAKPPEEPDHERSAGRGADRRR